MNSLPVVLSALFTYSFASLLYLTIEPVEGIRVASVEMERERGMRHVSAMDCEVVELAA